MSYYIPIYAIIIGLTMHRIDCQTINICANPEKGQSCAITCDTADFTQTIQFLLGGTPQVSCTVIGGIPACGPGLSQTGTTTTYTIAALSRGTHEGDWSCNYGSATSSAVSLVVKTVPSVINIIQTIPEVNSTEATDEVQVSAECYCIYPPTSVIDIFNSDGTSGASKKIATVEAGSIVANVNPGPPCDTHESKIEISNYTVQPDIGGSNVYIEIQFGTYKTAKYGPLNIKGPTTISTTELTNGATETSKLSTVSTMGSATTEPTSVSTSANTEPSISTVITTESSVSTSTTTEPSGLSEELRNIIIIVSSIGGAVVIVVVIVIVLCCKKWYGNNTRKKHRQKDLKKKEFKPDLNYNLQNAKNTQSKPAQTQDNHRKNEKAGNELYNLNTYDYRSPYDLGYGGREIPYSHGRSNLQHGPGYGGRKILYSDGRHNQVQYDPNYYSKHYTREMPYSVPFSGYGYPVQYNNIPRQDGRQYARHQPHHGYVDGYGPFDQSGHVDRYGPVDQSGYTRRQYDDNWDILF